MDIYFNNLQELKMRITPAIKSKIRELRSRQYLITEFDDIWEYLKTNKWLVSSNLTLYDIVNDILKLDNDTIEEYSIKRRNRNE